MANEPLAYLKRWFVTEGTITSMRERVDLTPDLEPWLAKLKPTVIPLSAQSTETRSQAALRKILFECDTIEAAAAVAREALPDAETASVEKEKQ